MRLAPAGGPTAHPPARFCRALQWATTARQVPQGGVLAGLLVDLAADPRQVYLAHTVRFPLHPAARALGIQPLVFRTALHQLREARLLDWNTDSEPDATHITVTLLPPSTPPDKAKTQPTAATDLH
ncbi:hypothetical protein ACWGJX_45920 [Streptomyces sp. NPDC054775]